MAFLIALANSLHAISSLSGLGSFYLPHSLVFFSPFLILISFQQCSEREQKAFKKNRDEGMSHSISPLSKHPRDLACERGRSAAGEELWLALTALSGTQHYTASATLLQYTLKWTGDEHETMPG